MLTLPIKRRWFDMIEAGEKKEEYRGDTPYYRARLQRYEGKEIEVCLRNGYRADSPQLFLRIRPVRRTGARPEWGGNPEEPCWVLEILGKIEGKEATAAWKP